MWKALQFLAVQAAKGKIEMNPQSRAVRKTLANEVFRSGTRMSPGHSAIASSAPSGRSMAAKLMAKVKAPSESAREARIRETHPDLFPGLKLLSSDQSAKQIMSKVSDSVSGAEA